ncbi:MAG: DUF4783 domain-containing protein [Ignavibacteria bacterium]|nr:DUF4783 domain-containing protein [Ignavibacteria bacterium]
MRGIKYLLLIVVLFQFAGGTFAQEDWWKDKKYKSEETKKKYELCKRTFKDIASGFSSSSVSLISQYFNNEVFLDILGNEKGTYNPNQAEFMLSDFMDYFKVVSFKYLSSYHKNSYAFVLGKYYYNIGSGKRELKASISLKYRNEIWYVDQINLN